MKYLVVVALSLAACVAESNKQQNQTTNANGERVVCTEETPTGDLIPRKVCRTEQVQQDQQRAGQDYVQRPIQKPTNGK